MDLLIPYAIVLHHFRNAVSRKAVSGFVQEKSGKATRAIRVLRNDDPCVLGSYRATSQGR